MKGTVTRMHDIWRIVEDMDDAEEELEEALASEDPIWIDRVETRLERLQEELNAAYAEDWGND